MCSWFISLFDGGEHHEAVMMSRRLIDMLVSLVCVILMILTLSYVVLKCRVFAVLLRWGKFLG